MAHLRKRVSEKISQARRGWQLPMATIALLTLIVGALLGAVYLYQASQAAEMGRSVEQLKQTKASLERENAQLEAEIAAAQDPERLVRRALQLGFKEAAPSEIDYVALPENGATGGTAPGRQTVTSLQPATSAASPSNNSTEPQGGTNQ